MATVLSECVAPVAVCSLAGVVLRGRNLLAALDSTKTIHTSTVRKFIQASPVSPIWAGGSYYVYVLEGKQVGLRDGASLEVVCEAFKVAGFLPCPVELPPMLLIENPDWVERQPAGCRVLMRYQSGDKKPQVTYTIDHASLKPLLDLSEISPDRTFSQYDRWLCVRYGEPGLDTNPQRFSLGSLFLDWYRRLTG